MGDKIVGDKAVDALVARGVMAHGGAVGSGVQIRLLGGVGAVTDDGEPVDVGPRSARRCSPCSRCRPDRRCRSPGS